MAATNKKAVGLATLTAFKSQHCSRNCDCRADAPQAAGTSTMNTYIGGALRHGRAALALVLAHGPADARIGRELRHGRDAFDNAIWLAEYCEADE
jgi:hypothetical protein